MRACVSFSNNTTDNKGRAKYATGDRAEKKAVLTGWGGSEARAIRRLWRRIPRKRLLPGMPSLFPGEPSPKTVRKPSRLTVFTAYVIHTVSFETGIYRLTPGGGDRCKISEVVSVRKRFRVQAVYSSLCTSERFMFPKPKTELGRNRFDTDDYWTRSKNSWHTTSKSEREFSKLWSTSMGPDLGGTSGCSCTESHNYGDDKGVSL